MTAVRSLDSRAAPDVWQALADPTRRALIDMLVAQPQSTSALCAAFPLTRFAVMKHLGVLEDAGLIASRKLGRVRTNYLNAAPLLALQDRWIAPRTKALARGLQGLADHFTATEDRMTDAMQLIDVALDWTIAAPVQAVWKALFERPEQWWPADYRAVGGDAQFSFAAELGAHLREATPAGGGIIWYSIYAIEPMQSVDLRGNLAARYGGPATSLLRLELLAGEASGTTILKLTDSLMGRVSETMRTSATEGWQAIIGKGLVASFDAD